MGQEHGVGWAARLSWLPRVTTLMFLLSGCASTSATVARAPTATQAATPTATGAATAISATPNPAGPCDPTKMTSPIMDGDLAVGQSSVLYGFNADYMLPDGLPNAPLEVDIHDNGAYVQGARLESQPVVEPVAFDIGICNSSRTETHRLTAFGATLTALTPYSGRLNTLNGCAFLYAVPSGAGGECASGFSPDVGVSLTFAASASAGAVATVAQAPAVELAPGVGLDVAFSIASPMTPAIERFRLGLGVDGAAVTYPALDTQTAINAPIARHWDGRGCTAPAMQSQLPNTSPAYAFYVCPPA